MGVFAMAHWTWKRRHIGPIGVDIGQDSIKMLQLIDDEKRLSVHRRQKRRISGLVDEQIQSGDRIMTMRQMLEEGDFHGTEAALCLANDKLKITSVRVSESDVTKTAAQIFKEAAFRFGLDPGRDSIQYLPAGTVRQGEQTKYEVILFAADRQAAEDGLVLLDQAGLTAVGLEPAPCALFRGFERTLRRDEERNGTSILLDVGRRFTTVVFGRSGEIGLAKVLPVGTGRFDEEIATRLGTSLQEAETVRRTLHASEGCVEQDDPSYASSVGRKPPDLSVCRTLTDAIRCVADELAREVSLCARYYTVTFRGHRIERTLVSGGGAYEPLLLAAIKAQLGVDVEGARPLQGICQGTGSSDDSSGELGCEWAVAFGLALRGWPAGQGPLSHHALRPCLMQAS